MAGTQQPSSTVPNNNQQFLPDVPVNPTQWQRMRNFLISVKATVESVVQNPDPPDQVTNVQLTTKPTGILVTWNSANRATSYVVYQALDSNLFSDAVAIGTINRANNLSFFDPAGRHPDVSTLTYWVQAQNGNVVGPLSTSVSAPEPLITGGISATLGSQDLLKNTTREGTIAPIGAPTPATPSSTNTGTGTVTFGSAHGWVTGTRCTVSAAGGGLTTGTTYYLEIPSATTAKFHTSVDDAISGANVVTLTASITATLNTDAVVIATIPAGAASPALASFRQEGTAANWQIRMAGKVPGTVYSWKLGPGDSTIGSLGEAAAEEDPPTGDICVFHDNPSASGAGVLAYYVGWNDGQSPLAGPTGPAGSTWFNGSGVPSSSLGADGDYYLRTSTGDIYTKTAGAWVLIENIVGPTGAAGANGANGTNGTDGATWFDGSGTPSSGLGSDGDFYLEVDSPNAASPALQLISTQLLSVDTASVTFSSIPQTYKHLLLVANGRLTSSVTDDNVWVQFNGDTGTNYYYQHFLAVNSGVTSNQQTNQTHVQFGDWAAATAGRSTMSGSSELWVYNYSGTVFDKTYKAINTGLSATSGTNAFFPEINAGGWSNTAAVSSMLVFPNSGNFKAGSVFSLYGML